MPQRLLLVAVVGVVDMIIRAAETEVAVGRRGAAKGETEVAVARRGAAKGEAEVALAWRGTAKGTCMSWSVVVFAQVPLIPQS